MYHGGLRKILYLFSRTLSPKAWSPLCQHTASDISHKFNADVQIKCPPQERPKWPHASVPSASTMHDTTSSSGTRPPTSDAPTKSQPLCSQTIIAIFSKASHSVLSEPAEFSSRLHICLVRSFFNITAPFTFNITAPLTF